MRQIQRDFYLNELIARKENGLIKVITGIRRCGKSYLLFKIYYDYLLSLGINKDNIIALSLDDDASSEYRDPKRLSQYIRDKLTNNADMHYIFIDEIQYAIAKEDLKSEKPLPLYGVLNGLMKLDNVDIYVTGSNSKLLSKDVLTEFRGRGDEVRIYPLTFKEYYTYLGGDKADAYEDYALYGGLPLVLAKTSPIEKEKYLASLFKEVYLKDIEERYNIAKPQVMAGLIDDLCSSIGSLTNASKIAKTLNSLGEVEVNSQTIATYLNYLEESFLFNEAKRYDVKGKKYFSFPSKFYCSDLGLRNARLSFRQHEEGHAMENIIYYELLSRGYSVDVGVVQLNEKDQTGKLCQVQTEIDFVVNAGMNKYYIQVSLNNDSLERELRPLLATNDFFKRIIVTKSRQKPWVDESGILHMGLYDFLLDEQCIK
ncbi:MAG: ATP-binding protein [Bacilli bacterium]